MASCLLCAQRGDGDDYVNFAFGKLPGKCAKPVRLFGRKSMLELNVFAVDITEIGERFGDYAQVDVFFLGVCSMPEDADARHPPGLLRLYGERPRARCTAEKHNEIAPPHVRAGVQQE